VKTIYLSDTAPYLRGAKGCSVLGYYWCSAMHSAVVSVETRKPFPEDQRAALNKPVGLYWSLAGLGRGRLPSCWRLLIEGLLLRAYLKINKRTLKSSGATRIFAFSGADWEFLYVVRAYSKALNLPFDIYLVDDYQSSLRANGASPSLCKKAAVIEGDILRQAQKVYAISPGYVEHLRHQYGVNATWMPLPVPLCRVVYRPVVQSDAIRRVFYIGSVNSLYVEGIRGFIQILRERISRGESWRLVVVSGAPASQLDKFLGPAWREVVDLRRADSREELKTACAEALAYLLPYSSEPSMGLLVRTSFPSKLTDYLTDGRPILVHGPADSSAVRYARENSFPLVSTTFTELDRNLDLIGVCDNASTIDIYSESILRYHSPEALIRILSEGASS